MNDRSEHTHITTRCVRVSTLLIGLAICTTILNAQATEPEFDVKWIGQFPEPAGTVRPSFKERLSGWIFGEKPFTLMRPFNVAATDPDNYFVLDQGMGSIAAVRNGEERLIPGMSRAGRVFPSLVGICSLHGGDLLFTDSSMDKVFRIANGKVYPLGDTLLLEQPTGIAYSMATDEIWVVETSAHRISVLDSEGKLLRRMGTRGTAPGNFNFPTFIWIDRQGHVYIVDSMNFRVQVFDKNGVFQFCFGESGDATGNMARPKGVATDSYGNIYVADALFHAVQIFNREGSLLYAFGKQGQQPGEFWMPSGICIDQNDFIYVADGYNARIQVFQLVQN